MISITQLNRNDWINNKRNSFWQVEPRETYLYIFLSTNKKNQPSDLSNSYNNWKILIFTISVNHILITNYYKSVIISTERKQTTGCAIYRGSTDVQPGDEVFPEIHFISELRHIELLIGQHVRATVIRLERLVQLWQQHTLFISTQHTPHASNQLLTDHLLHLQRHLAHSGICDEDRIMYIDLLHENWQSSHILIHINTR